MELNEILNNLQGEMKFAKTNYVPIIREKSAEYLYNFVKNGGYQNILEIGTAIGFSGSIILGAGAKTLTTIDINEDYLKMAKNTFAKFGFLDKVTTLFGDAKNYIEELKNQGKKFDMIFLDGAKGQYVNYLPTLAKLLNNNGVIFADNVLLHGMVESQDKIPHKKRTMVVNLRKYLEKINEYPFETKLVRLEDGIAITKLKGEENV